MVGSKASVIISTYNGAQKLPHLLQSLLKQTVATFELIVVVDGSTDNTIEVLHDYRSSFSAFHVIEQPNGGRSKVRNRGASESTGRLLIFYDDDMVVGPDSVERHLFVHKDGVDKLVSGRTIELVEGGKTDVQNYKANRSIKWTSKYTEPLTILDERNLFFTAANCSIGRRTFERLNGFDEGLTDAEDFNMAQRAVKLSIPVYFDLNNYAVHREFITARGFVVRQRAYYAAQQRAAALSPALTRSDTHRTNKMKRLVYRLLAHAKAVKWIEEERLMFIPASLRYKLYDMIFHALSFEYPSVEI